MIRAGKIRSARRHKNWPTSGLGLTPTLCRANGRYRRNPESRKNTVTPKSPRDRIGPSRSDRSDRPLMKPTWVQTTANAASARMPSSAGNRCVAGSVTSPHRTRHRERPADSNVHQAKIRRRAVTADPHGRRREERESEVHCFELREGYAGAADRRYDLARRVEDLDADHARRGLVQVDPQEPFLDGHGLGQLDRPDARSLDQQS